MYLACFVKKTPGHQSLEGHERAARKGGQRGPGGFREGQLADRSVVPDEVSSKKGQSGQQRAHSVISRIVRKHSERWNQSKAILAPGAGLRRTHLDSLFCGRMRRRFCRLLLVVAGILGVAFVHSSELFAVFPSAPSPAVPTRRAVVLQRPGGFARMPPGAWYLCEN